MKPPLRQAHALASWVLVATIVVQVFLAGAALPNLGGSGDFAAHIDFGFTIVGLAALAVVLTAVAARVARRDVALALGLLVLYFVQTALPALRLLVPVLAALHVVNALLLFALSVWYARRATKASRGGQQALAQQP